MKKIVFKKGFTLLEVCIAVVLIGILSLMAMSDLWQSIPALESRQGIKQVQEILIAARNKAVKKSSTVIVDFSAASNAQNGKGGIIEIELPDGTVVESHYLNKNVLLNTSSTTVGTSVRFNYRGQPVDSSGSASAVTDSNNNVAVSFYRNGTALYTKSLKIMPFTGQVK